MAAIEKQKAKEALTKEAPLSLELRAAAHNKEAAIFYSVFCERRHLKPEARSITPTRWRP